MEHDELSAYLDALQREECYRVDEVLKESPYEVTQRVSFLGANGAEQGPFIRKFIKREAGLGSAYERLYEAQRQGHRFKHLPIILEFYVRGDELAVVMEYARGETLQDLVYRADPSLELARNVFPTLCDAVSELHEGFNPPIIHRDLKPSNVILSQGGCTIIDFGIAREFKDGADADTAHFGTRAFAPPEQFGFGQTTVRSDVYALGMLLYFCLTEVIPDANDRASWYEDQRIPKHMRGVIAKATAFDPNQRYARASELKAAFYEAIDMGEKERKPDWAAAARQGRPIPSQPSPPLGTSPQSQSAPFAQTASYAQASTQYRGNPASNQVQPPEYAETPHIIGRIWNAIVIVAYAAFLIFVIYHVANIIAFEPSRLGATPWLPVLKTSFAMVFFALFAFACLDKRRIRQRIPFFANVKPWQVWVVVLIAFMLITLFSTVVPT